MSTSRARSVDEMSAHLFYNNLLLTVLLVKPAQTDGIMDDDDDIYNINVFPEIVDIETILKSLLVIAFL